MKGSFVKPKSVKLRRMRQNDSALQTSRLSWLKDEKISLLHIGASNNITSSSMIMTSGPIEVQNLALDA